MQLWRIMNSMRITFRMRRRLWTWLFIYFGINIFLLIFYFLCTRSISSLQRSIQTYLFKPNTRSTVLRASVQASGLEHLCFAINGTSCTCLAIADRKLKVYLPCPL